MCHAAPIDGVSLLPRSVAGRRLVSIRARRRRQQLDAALAQGADPWSTPELMVRASRLGLLSERRKIAAGLHRLIALATRQRRASPILAVRHEVVLEQRDSLLALAERVFSRSPSTLLSLRNSHCFSRIRRVPCMRMEEVQALLPT
jgi:hypothetical protein